MEMEKYTIDAALSRLEEITTDLEKGEYELETAMKVYEEGVRLIAYCNKSLNAAAQKVAELSQIDMSGDETDE